MFYVKEIISKKVVSRVEINDDNVFCTCPGCGHEVLVDLAELFRKAECDLYSTVVYCQKCSKERMGRNHE